MRVEGDGYKQLNNAIQGASFTYSPRTSKADIIEYYRETYKGRGGQGWRKHLAGDLSAQTGIKAKNLERRLDPSRINNPEKRNAAQYRELGQKLPLKKEPKDTAGKRARVTFTGEFMTYDDKNPRVRTYTGTLSASEAREMRKGSFEPIFASFGFTPGIITYIDVDQISVDFI